MPHEPECTAVVSTAQGAGWHWMAVQGAGGGAAAKDAERACDVDRPSAEGTLISPAPAAAVGRPPAPAPAPASAPAVPPAAAAVAPPAIPAPVAAPVAAAAPAPPALGAPRRLWAPRNLLARLVDVLPLLHPLPQLRSLLLSVLCDCQYRGAKAERSSQWSGYSPAERHAERWMMPQRAGRSKRKEQQGCSSI